MELHNLWNSYGTPMEHPYQMQSGLFGTKMMKRPYGTPMEHRAEIILVVVGLWTDILTRGDMVWNSYGTPMELLLMCLPNAVWPLRH